MRGYISSNVIFGNGLHVKELRNYLFPDRTSIDRAIPQKKPSDGRLFFICGPVVTGYAGTNLVVMPIRFHALMVMMAMMSCAR